MAPVVQQDQLPGDPLCAMLVGERVLCGPPQKRQKNTCGDRFASKSNRGKHDGLKQVEETNRKAQGILISVPVQIPLTHQGPAYWAGHHSAKRKRSWWGPPVDWFLFSREAKRKTTIFDKQTRRDTEGAGIWGDSLDAISHIKLSQGAFRGNPPVSNWFPLYPCELVSLNFGRVLDPSLPTVHR